MKKSYYLIMLLMLLAGIAGAQSPWAITHSRSDVRVEATRTDDGGVSIAAAAVVSPRNLWIGSSVLWNVDDNAPIESPGIHGKLLYTMYSHDRFSLPILGNISLSDNGEIESPDEGISVGAYPWYELTSDDRFSLVAHGGVGYRRYTDIEDIDQTEIKLQAGLEVAVGTLGDLPATLNVSPVFRLGQGDLPNTTALEVTGIFPIGNGLGFMASGNFPFEGGDSLFRLGILASGRL